MTHRLKIEKFVEYYLGTRDRPVPFGGRQEVLGELSQWLSDQTGPRHLLATAPAGRGKTALLVNWMQLIPASWNVAFVPISIRFQTNHASIFYEAMAHELARIASATVGATQRDAGEFYRDRCLELLHEIDERKFPTVLIVDGLDEASGWEIDWTLLQSKPGSSTRIIVSARVLAGDKDGPSGWLHRLDWPASQQLTKCVVVPPLSGMGISEALQSMGYPIASLSSRIDIIGKLKILTDGDPLLVRMYAESLWNTGDASQSVRPGELERLDPGFGGFFKSWFEKQSGNWSTPNSPFRRQLEAILAILSVALGPIEHRHLEAVCANLPGNQVNSLSIKDIEPIRRFLIGDGRENGYSFQHPKFSQYFKDEYFVDGNMIDSAEHAIKTWCKEIVVSLNRGALHSNNVPAYIIEHCVQHLAKAADDVEAMSSLLSEESQRAWFEHDGGYARYSTDIADLMHVFRGMRNLDQGIQLAIRIRCGLILSSIRSIGVNTPIKLIVTLVRHGKLSSRQALHRLELQDASSLARGLSILFDAVDPATKILILTVIEGIGDEWTRVSALASLAQRLPEPLLERALTAAEGIRSNGAKSRLLASLAQRLPEPLLERALTAAEGIRSDRARAGTLAALADRLPEPLRADVAERALTAAEGIGGDGARAGALASLAEHLPQPFLLAVADGDRGDRG